MTELRSIAVVEPQMHNLFHSPFNAALLHAIVLAFPNAKVSFSALPGHAGAVRGILEDHAAEVIPRVNWRMIEEPPNSSLISRWRSNRRTIAAVLQAGRHLLGARERIIFCSISRMQLMQLKRMMTPADEVLAVLHGDLDRIAEPETEQFPASFFSLRRVLLKKQPGGLRYVLLGDSIRRNIPVEFEAAFANSVVLDHPYHFPAAKAASEATEGKPLVFGVFGNSGDGRLLEQVAREVKASAPNTRIVLRMIGFVADAEVAARLAPLVEGVGGEPISRDEFVRRAESITYALWLAPAGSFRLRASGTFFDSLAYLKPLVYVANPFIDSYLSSEREIGYRCVSAEEAGSTIIEVASRHDLERYSERQAAIEEFRLRFTPEALARTLPSKFDW